MRKVVEELRRKAEKVPLQSKEQRLEKIRNVLRRRKGMLSLSENASLPALHLVKAGDILASLDTKSWVSRGLAKMNGSPYSHVGVFTGRNANNELLIRDFRKGRAGVTRPFTEAHKKGMVYAILRWEQASPKQIEAFLRNINKIKGHYDVPLLASYGINELNKKLGIKNRVAWDVESWWTCSEQVSHAADPSKKLIDKGILEPVQPPLKPVPGLDANYVTPRILTVDGVNNRMLRIVTMRKIKSE